MDSIISYYGQRSDRHRVLNNPVYRRLTRIVFDKRQVTLTENMSSVSSRFIYLIGNHHDTLLQYYSHSFMNFMYPQNKGLFKSNVASVAQVTS